MSRAASSRGLRVALLAAWVAVLAATPPAWAVCISDAECDDQDSCTLDLCSVGTGTCEHITLPSGSGCDDGNFCTIAERCDSLGVCGGGTAKPNGASCDQDGSPCTVDTCQAGLCDAGPALPDTTPCNDGNSCTTGDTCQAGACVGPNVLPDGNLCVDGDPCTLLDSCLAGVCVPGAFLDTDGDGDSDCEETDCGCDPGDSTEVCILPNRLAGRVGSVSGEVLIEFFTPTRVKVNAGTDDSCGPNGKCALAGDGRLHCTRGKVWDLCTVDSDCDEPVNTCRLIVNWPKPPTPPAAPLALEFARRDRTDISAGFTPVTQGCSKKVDVPLDPSRRSNRVILKARGTANGRVRKERDRLKYEPVTTP